MKKLIFSLGLTVCFPLFAMDSTSESARQDDTYKTRMSAVQSAEGKSAEDDVLSRLIPSHLDNDLCTKTNKKGEKEKVFVPRTQTVNSIMLIWTGEGFENVEDLKKIYYSKGTSTHIVVDKDAQPYRIVEDDQVAFYAGPSQWKGVPSVNQYCIGIDNIFDGFVPSKSPKEGVILPGDTMSRKWVEWPLNMVDSIGELVASEQRKHNIRGRNVLAHSDARMPFGDKWDIGPLFPWKYIRDKFGAAYWPMDHEINLEDFKDLKEEHYADLITRFGFPDSNWQRFKLHFYPGNISPDLDDATKKMILNLTIDYYNYEDPIVGGKDEEFRAALDEYLKKNELESIFRSYWEKN